MTFANSSDPRARAGSRFTLRALGALAALAALAAASLAAPDAAVAQSPASPGTLSVSMGLESSPEAGIWFTATNHTRIGLIGTLSRSTVEVEGPDETSEPETLTRYSAGPALKWYLSGNQQRVAPFWYVAGTGGVTERPSDIRTTTFTGDLGFGVDWFPVPQISLGATTGLSYVRDRTTGGDSTQTASSLRAATGGIRMHIYF